MNSGEVSKEDVIKLAENGIGNYIQLNREARDYSQQDICDGICSVSTFSRIEQGGKIVDYQMIEGFLSRMKISKASYEFVLDEEDYVTYKHREIIETLIREKKYEKAEKELEAYEKKYGTNKLQGQFIFFHRGLVELIKPQTDPGKIKELFERALVVTAKNYRSKLENRKILSDLELECIIEITHCIEDSAKREEEQQKLYQYFQWSREREGFFAFAFRAAMLYYAETLYENKKFDRCIQICDEVLDIYYGTSKLGERAEVFLIRAKAREARGIKEEKDLYIRDLKTAYYTFSFYDGEESIIKKQIEEEYRWLFTD